MVLTLDTHLVFFSNDEGVHMLSIFKEEDLTVVHVPLFVLNAHMLPIFGMTRNPTKRTPESDTLVPMLLWSTTQHARLDRIFRQ